MLNVDIDDHVRTPDQFRIMREAGPAVRRLNEAGLAAVIVSNQSGVGRGIIRPEDLAEMDARLAEAMRAAGAHLDATYYCVHHPDAGCDCRKPKPGMLLQAAQDLGLDLARSAFVGDARRDLQAARAAGCAAVLLLTGMPRQAGCQDWTPAPDACVRSLTQAVDWALRRNAPSSGEIGS